MLINRKQISITPVMESEWLVVLKHSDRKICGVWWCLMDIKTKPIVSSATKSPQITSNDVKSVVG